MTTIAAIRTALSDAVDALDNVRAVGYVTDAVTVTQATVVRKAVTYDLTMGRGADVYQFGITVYVARNPIDQAQKQLDTFADPGSNPIKAAVETDAVASAGGVDYIRVVSCGEIQVATIGTIDYLTEEFTIEVVA